MKTRYARTIGAFRTSGHNPRPAPPHPPLYEPESDDGYTVNLGTSRAAQRIHERADSATDVAWGDPPRVDPATPAATVWLAGEPIRVPLGWGIAFSSRQGRDALYLRESGGPLHVLLVNADGQVRELNGMPADIIEDLTRANFPRGT